MRDDSQETHVGRLLAGVMLAIGAWYAGSGLDFGVHDAQRGRMALAITTFIASCWLLRSLPLGPASLLPIALFPLCNVRSTKAVAAAYADPVIWLFFGGFVLALSVERWDLHRRLALWVVGRVGLRPRRLVLGFLLAGLFLSMWISNTATSLMLLPIAGALVERMKTTELESRVVDRFGIALMLGIAYGCSVGGTATRIGTAPNALYYSAAYDDMVARLGAPPMTFLDWMVAFVPFALIFGVLIWLLLVHVLYRLPVGDKRTGSLIAEEIAALGPITVPQKRVVMLFCFAVLLWVTRADMDLGGLKIPGWTTLLSLHGPGGTDREFVKDGAIAILVAALAFVLPSGAGGAERGRLRLMDWQSARRVPFDILFLLGGGVAIAQTLQETHVSAALARLLHDAGALPPVVMVALIVTMVTFLTEVTSNTATTALMLSVLPAMARDVGFDPRVVMLPATIAASCAFMLPIATPPNAVVFSSGRVTTGQMASAGFVLNLVSIVMVTAFCWFWVFPILGIDPTQVPTWWK